MCSDGALTEPSSTKPPASSTSATTSTTSTSTTSPPINITTTTSTSAIAGDAACWASPTVPSVGPVELEDATESLGLIDPLLGIHGHAAAWGDVNRDGWADLYVGTFADRPGQAYRQRGASGPSPDRFFWGGPNGFSVDASFPEMRGRASGAVFADLDSDGTPELVVAQNGGRSGTPATSVLDLESGAWRRVELPVSLGARAVGVLDADGDGLLDLFITEDRWSGGSSRLLRNEGDLAFADVTHQAGLPPDIHGLGVSTADLDGDGRPDIFVSGSNRLFVNRGGTFREVSSRVFDWEEFEEEDDVAGVAVADLNRDRRPDLVLGQHFNSTVETNRSVPIRLYLNLGGEGEELEFADVTEEAGLIAIPTKAPHVEIVDIDNDSWPDIVTSASAGDGTRPAIFMHQGLRNGIPYFQAPAGLGSDQHWVTGGAADADHDGRQDLFLVEWEPSLPSLMLRNTTEGGHWLSIGAAGAGFGPGTVVDVYVEGSAGDPGALVGSRQVVLTTGYAAGILPVAHFGLGEHSAVDVVFTSPGGDSRVLVNVEADRHVELEGCQ
jgi:hypothetical protein